MKKDLRYFIRTIEEKAPELLLHIPREVSPRWELSCVQKRLEAEDRLPVLVFDKIAGYDMPIVTNLFASKQHLALALETSMNKVVSRFTEAKKNPLEPRIVNSNSAPVKDIVLKDDEADLRILPLVTHCEKDAGPYLSSGIGIIRDPTTGHLNAGIYRNRYISPKQLTFNMAPLCHASQIMDRAEANKQHVDTALVIGHHPAMGMVSQQRGQLGEFELDTMGGLLGEPVDLVPCETVDLMVPADAEIVIEGRVRTDLWDDDGPFGDYWLYYAPTVKARVFEVTAITRREDAIFNDIFSVGPEHVVLFSLGMEGMVLSQLQQLIPQVKAVNVPVSGVGNLLYVQIKKEIEGLGVNTTLAALGVYRFKTVIVVDEDVDIFDDKKVMWAMMTRTQADRSFFTVPGSYVSRADLVGYSAWHSNGKGDRLLSSRLGIDATKPLDPSFPEVAEPPKRMWTQLDLKAYLK